MREMTIKVYKFNELSEGVQESIIEKEKERGLWYGWYEFVFDDAKEIGDILGIKIDKIYFSGFWRQGDGACFEGEYFYKKQCIQNIKEYAPEDKKLHEIAERLTKVQKRNFYDLYATVKHSGHYHHEYCTHIHVEYNGNIDRNAVSDDDTEEMQDILRDFMRWIYKRLENEYEYLTSDEVLKENLIELGYEFTEEGEIV